MFHHFKHGELRSEGNSITEGIGQGRVTANIASAPVDDAFQIPDEEMLPVLFRLLREEGLCLGGSTGINVAGAVRLARELGPGHTIVTVLCDFGQPTSPSSTTPNSCAARACRCRIGWKTSFRGVPAETDFCRDSLLVPAMGTAYNAPDQKG
jgi:hypothetical protein